MQEFGEESDDLTVAFNSCWAFGRAKCVIYKPKWEMWRDGANFAALSRTYARTDCEVEAVFYEV